MLCTIFQYLQNLPQSIPLDVDLFWEQEAVLNLLCIYKPLSSPPPSLSIYLGFSLCLTLSVFQQKLQKIKTSANAKTLWHSRTMQPMKSENSPSDISFQNNCFLHIIGGHFKRNGNNASRLSCLHSSNQSTVMKNDLLNNVNLQETRLLKLEICFSFTEGTKILVRS